MVSPASARHIADVAMAAVVIDAAYTAVFWLIMGRPHRARRYFLIVGQLSAETALILHLLDLRSRAVTRG